jgi:hypothetical protein
MTNVITLLKKQRIIIVAILCTLLVSCATTPQYRYAAPEGVSFQSSPNNCRVTISMWTFPKGQSISEHMSTPPKNILRWFTPYIDAKDKFIAGFTKDSNEFDFGYKITFEYPGYQSEDALLTGDQVKNAMFVTLNPLPNIDRSRSRLIVYVKNHTYDGKPVPNDYAEFNYYLAEAFYGTGEFSSVEFANSLPPTIPENTFWTLTISEVEDRHVASGAVTAGLIGGLTLGLVSVAPIQYDYTLNDRRKSLYL